MRGLWTWPPWVICALAFNHKIGNDAHSGASEVLFFTKSYKWKKQRWKNWIPGRLLLETLCFWRSLTVRQFKMADRRMRAQQKLKLDVAWQCPDYSLLFPCSISFAESFVICLRNKAYVYLLTYLSIIETVLRIMVWVMPNDKKVMFKVWKATVKCICILLYLVWVDAQFLLL